MAEDTIGPPILNPAQSTLKESLSLKMVSSADRGHVTQAQYVAGLFLPGAMASLQFFSDLAIILLGWLSVSLEVFLRRDFGERYLSPIRLFLAVALMTVLGSGAAFLNLLFSSQQNPDAYRWNGRLFTVFFAVFILLSIFHRFRISRRNRKGIQWHSMSFGVSWLQSILPFSDWTLYTLVEPILCLVIGFILTYIDPTAAVWMMVTAFALLLKNQMVYVEQRDKILDLIDSRIEAGYFQESLHGKVKQQTAGFSVVPVPAAQIRLIEEAAPDLAATVHATLNEPVAAIVPAAVMTPDFAATLQSTLGETPATISGMGEKKEMA